MSLFCFIKARLYMSRTKTRLLGSPETIFCFIIKFFDKYLLLKFLYCFIYLETIADKLPELFRTPETDSFDWVYRVIELNIMAVAAMYPMINEKPFNDEDCSDEQNYFLPALASNRHSSNTNQNYSVRKSRRVTFFKNGDKYFSGKSVAITPSKYFSFRELMNDLNRSVDLPYGVRRVYTPVSGREIYDIEELEDGSSYVCASFEPFRPAKYGELSKKKSSEILFFL